MMSTEEYKNYTKLTKWVIELNMQVEALREELKEVSQKKIANNKPKIIPMKIEKRG